MRRLFANILSIAVGLAGGNVVAQDYKPDFDPGALKGPRVGTPNQILVLATAHLSGLPASFKAADLQLLIDRLIAGKWGPSVTPKRKRSMMNPKNPEAKPSKPTHRDQVIAARGHTIRAPKRSTSHPPKAVRSI